jgi:putative NIF3 family GTP cyclohydrolase 1 type 2
LRRSALNTTKGTIMNQAELMQRLDAFFDVQAYDESGFWADTIPAKDLAIYRRFLGAQFMQGTWNGLMLDSADEIDRVYLIVYPDRAALDTILARELERSAPGALIFAHHPVDFSEGKTGIAGINEAQLEALREHHISYYACHAPLDCHPEISTGGALAKALKLRDGEAFVPYHGGLKGVHGRVNDMTFGNFTEFLSKVTDLPYICYNQIRFNGQPVEHVAVVPGSGDNPRYLEKARDLGCDTYVTGQWWLSGEYDYASQQRAALSELIPTLPMNMLGTSHYASQMVVMRDEMPGWFRNAGIEAKFIKQPDPWR